MLRRLNVASACHSKARTTRSFSHNEAGHHLVGIVARGNLYPLTTAFHQQANPREPERERERERESIMGVVRCICFRPWNDADHEADADIRQMSQDQIMATKEEAGMVRTRQAVTPAVALAQPSLSCRRRGILAVWSYYSSHRGE